MLTVFQAEEFKTRHRLFATCSRRLHRGTCCRGLHIPRRDPAGTGETCHRLNEMTDRLFRPTLSKRGSQQFTVKIIWNRSTTRNQSRDYVDCPIIDFRSSNICAAAAPLQRNARRLQRAAAASRTAQARRGRPLNIRVAAAIVLYQLISRDADPTVSGVGLLLQTRGDIGRLVHDRHLFSNLPPPISPVTTKPCEFPSVPEARQRFSQVGSNKLYGSDEANHYYLRARPSDGF